MVPPGVNSVFNAALVKPYCPVSWIDGKKAARATLMSKFAATSWASASATSGRRCNTAEGRPGVTGGSASLLSEPGRAVIASGGRPTRMPRPISSCSSWLRRFGIVARSPATSDSCWATSSALAVPASSRPRITASVCSASARLRCATTSRSASASAMNQVLATLVTTVSATTCWSKRLNIALAARTAGRRGSSPRNPPRRRHSAG